MLFLIPLAIAAALLPSCAASLTKKENHLDYDAPDIGTGSGSNLDRARDSASRQARNNIVKAYCGVRVTQVNETTTESSADGNLIGGMVMDSFISEDSGGASVTVQMDWYKLQCGNGRNFINPDTHMSVEQQQMIDQINAQQSQ
ncbi:MAG: hypothetical protein Q7T11_08940 [Deltaproteobacteria bacterium]|nr:hypothetical protein [Deltaproteobacteria bacterium]